MTPLSPGDMLADPPPPRLPADHPGVNELFAVLAYGEVAAFYRLTEEARMAPDLRGRISMASMAAAEMAHYEVLHDTLESRGVDVVPAISKYASALDGYHRLTTPSTWLEALVKTYVGDSLAADFYLQIADGLPDQIADVVRAAQSADRKLIAAVTVFDVYEGPGIEPGKKSVALAVTIQPRERTMTDEEIEALAAKIVSEVGKRTGGVLRA